MITALFLMLSVAWSDREDPKSLPEASRSRGFRRPPRPWE